MPQNVGVCHGNGDDHCCYFSGEVCPHLEENTVPGRRWACGLYRQYGDWDVVKTSPEYVADVEPRWRASGPLYEWFWNNGVWCGTWGDPDGPMIQGLRVPGNAPQYVKDFQTQIIACYQQVQQGGSCDQLCCFGNAYYAQDTT